eukprot:gene22481-biopygen22244
MMGWGAPGPPLPAFRPLRRRRAGGKAPGGTRPDGDAARCWLAARRARARARVCGGGGAADAPPPDTPRRPWTSVRRGNRISVNRASNGRRRTAEALVGKLPGARGGGGRNAPERRVCRPPHAPPPALSRVRSVPASTTTVARRAFVQRPCVRVKECSSKVCRKHRSRTPGAHSSESYGLSNFQRRHRPRLAKTENKVPNHWGGVSELPPPIPPRTQARRAAPPVGRRFAARPTVHAHVYVCVGGGDVGARQPPPPRRPLDPSVSVQP